MVRTITRGAPCQRGFAGSLDPVQAWHVWAGARGRLDRLGAVTRLADDAQVGLVLEHLDEAAAHERLVVDDKYAERLPIDSGAR